MSRKKINKHLSNYSTLNSIAYRVIKEGIIYHNQGLTIEYDKNNNQLLVSDYCTKSVYIPKITSDSCDPFAKLLYKNINEGIINE